MVALISFIRTGTCFSVQSFQIYEGKVESDLGPVSQSLLWKGPPIVKERIFFSFWKATLKFIFTKPPFTSLTKSLP